MNPLSDQAGKVLRFAAIYDIAFTGLLAIPPAVPVIMGIIASIDTAMGFGTEFLPLDATSVFFMNLGAISVIAWGAIRILRPSLVSLLVDALYRGALVAAQLWAVFLGATPVLLGISAVLILLSLTELYTWNREQKRDNIAKV